MFSLCPFVLGPHSPSAQVIIFSPLCSFPCCV